jgi:phosphopantothenoylcysteine decarboxylase/phosphopantothenate--cysteine ligase
MTQDLNGKKIVLGLTGGVACYKAAELCRALVKQGARVQVVMSEAATHFITPTTMQALSNHPVVLDQWDARAANSMAHINLTREADAVLVAPASADFLAQLAQGRAGDLLSLLCLARPIERCALLLAPAMNREMWAHPATQRNVAQVRADGATVLGPDAGDQACGEVGDGRMLEPEDIVEQLIGFFQPKLLRGHRVLLTAGPTFEPIDPVRGITNLSSGKMGFALARAAAQAGAEVTLVAGPCHQDTPAGVLRIDVQTAQQMHDAVMRELDTSKSDIFIAVAAVADWRVAQAADHKLKKQNDTDVPALTFTQNPDILAAVAHRANAPFCVGFAAETERLEEFGEAKRQKKGIPLLVGNLGHQTFGRDDNEVALFEAAGITRLPRADKLTLARQIVAAIADRVHGARP